MGKDKQRTKGGVKPSSSGRTAELLFKSALPVDPSSVFSGFVPVVPFGPDFDSQGSTVSSELRLLLRKFGKKDATTKIKALGEVTEVFNMDTQACSDVLQYWPRIYSKLAVDEARKVRELSHVALEAIGKQVGRNLGPHMKVIAPYWFLGQFDIYAPAGSTATKAFKAVFATEKKQEDALKFCLDEILSLLVESLTCTSSSSKAGKSKADAAAADDSSGDSEPYELRMTYASIQGLSKLIELKLVDETHLLPFIDSDSFWGLTKNSSSAVRRQFFNLVTTIANWKPTLIQRQCIKAITHSLKEETSDCLQSLWNCFLTLTLNCQAFTADSNMAKAQIVKVCKKGFYGNARSLGPALLPIVAKIGVDNEFISQLLTALQVGYTQEKSVSEKVAMLKSYAETLAYYLSTTDASNFEKVLISTVFPFVAAVINSGNFRDFASTFGTLIKTEVCYASMTHWFGIDENFSQCQNNLGNFIVALCYASDLPQGNKCVRFAADEVSGTPDVLAFHDLPPYKQTLVVELGRKSLTTDSLTVFAALARSFRSEEFYSAFSDGRPEKILQSPAFQQSKDFGVKLGIIVELISTFPAVPVFLSELSNIFETSVSDANSLKTFLVALKPHEKTVAVKRWMQQELFSSKVRQVVTNSEELYDSEIFVIKYVLQHQFMFGADLVKYISDRLLRRLELCEGVQDLYVSDLTHVIRCTGSLEAEVMKPLMTGLVKFVIRCVANAADEAKEVVNRLAVEVLSMIPICGVYDVDVLSAIHDQLDLCNCVGQIDALVAVTDLLGSAVTSSSSNVFFLPRLDRQCMEDALNFTNLSVLKIQNSLITASTCRGLLESFRLGHITRAIFDLKVILSEDSDDVNYVDAITKLLCAQSMCVIWRELEKYSFVKTLNDEIVTEFTILSSRILERLATNKWARYREDILDRLSKSSRDFLLASKLPLQLFLESAKKLDLELSFVGRTKPLNQFIMDDSKALNNTDSEVFLDKLISDYFLEYQVVSVASVVDYFVLQRKDCSSEFYFEALFSQVPDDKKLNLLMILEAVNKILKQIVDSDDKANDEFITSAACWIAAWLKQTKNIPTELDVFTLLWINKLGRGVTLIANLARRPGIFASEYLEFHASNLYVPLYYIFLQLTRLDLENFAVCRTAEVCANALTTVPSITLRFIEPVAATLCSKFVPLLSSRKPAIQIAAGRVLRKVKASVMTVEGNEEICIIPAELNDLIKELGEEITSEEISTLQSSKILSFLLAWDVLLTMHADRSCNEFGNFAKESHLLPRLLSLLFFKFLDFVPESKIPFYFESVPKMTVEDIPPNFNHLTCNVLLKCLQCLPYSARWWWNTQLSKQRDKVMVERFISKYLSSKLITDELGRVQWEDSEYVTVQAHPGCNELIAHYKIEDTTVSITISLPLNHPLGPISVKISDKKLLGKITNLLNNKSNSLAAGLKLWKESMDAKFSGHEECAICFFILHGSTKSLPKMTCRTCNHKFHSACLLKWFNTSNKSECPLCRNLF